MDVLLFLALVLFAAGTIVSAIQKSWTQALLFAGLAVWVLAETGLLT